MLVAFFLISTSLLIELNLAYSPLSNIEERGDFFEGDIEGIDKNDIIKGIAQIPTETRDKWPNGVVPFVFDAPYSDMEKSQIYSGMRYLEDSTRVNGRDCIKIVPHTIEPNYVRIYNGSGCSSAVGKARNPGAQNLSLGPGCFVMATIAHEFLHTLGFWHEQSRPDRDDHITVMYENISEGNEHNFNKYNESQVDYMGFDYDYDSCMHYSAYGFSKNGQPTIVPKVPGVVIGQRKYMSPIDIAEVRTFYNCK